jgi:CheY-like chemotaxis protein/anti-sigma regulatory factor (Ser/Thr protein kinase)
VLINLLSNAVKFTPEGGRVQLSVRAHPEQETVEFAISDTGIGIAANQMDKLFQPFIQLDSSLSRRYSGTGLGLALVRRIVELHGGSVSLESDVGRGSCFTVMLPWRRPTLLQKDSNPSPLLSTQSVLIQRALIVEDSESAANQVSRYLAELGATTVVHPIGQGVVDLALQTKPDVIILDILLPDLPGWDVLMELKAHPLTRAIPVLIISVVDERAKGLALGASDYLLKPIARGQLQHALNRLTEVVNQELKTALVVAHPISSPLVVLAEDNEANIEVILSYLQAYGLRTAIARNGLEAVQLVKECQPDLVLMDIQMPEMDGLEATRQIRAEANLQTLPIIALTALAMPGDRDRCLTAGATEYLTKPVGLKQLLQVIKHYLPNWST